VKLARALPGRTAATRTGRTLSSRPSTLEVMLVRWAELDREGNALRIYQHMVLGARFAAIRRIRAGLVAPLFAGTLEASSAARDQAMAAAACSSSSRTWCNLRQTPASFQSRSRRQQVIPLPQPISWGSISQGLPLLRTKRMPVNAARSGTGGRPPFGVRRRFGSSGAIRAHNLSPTNVAATAHFYSAAISRPVSDGGFVRDSEAGPLRVESRLVRALPRLPTKSLATFLGSRRPSRFGRPYRALAPRDRGPSRGKNSKERRVSSRPRPRTGQTRRPMWTGSRGELPAAQGHGGDILREPGTRPRGPWRPLRRREGARPLTQGKSELFIEPASTDHNRIDLRGAS